MPVKAKYLRGSRKMVQIEDDVTRAAVSIEDSPRFSGPGHTLLAVDPQMYYSENGLPGRLINVVGKNTQAYIEREQANLFRGYVKSGSFEVEFEGARSEVIAGIIDQLSKLGF